VETSVLLLDKPSNGVEVENHPKFLQGEFLNPITESTTPASPKKVNRNHRGFSKEVFKLLEHTTIQTLLPNRSIVLDVTRKKKEKTRWGTMCHQF
jgi:hypothetical protein